MFDENDEIPEVMPDTLADFLFMTGNHPVFTPAEFNRILLAMVAGHGDEGLDEENVAKAFNMFIEWRINNFMLDRILDGTINFMYHEDGTISGVAT